MTSRGLRRGVIAFFVFHKQGEKESENNDGTRIFWLQGL